RQVTTDRGRTPLAWAPTGASPQVPAAAGRRARGPLGVATGAVAGLAGGVAWGRVDGGGDSGQAAATSLTDAPAGPAKTPPGSPAHAIPVAGTPAGDAGEIPDNVDPWGGRPETPGHAAAEHFTLARTGKLAAAQARRELAAAVVHVPVDTQVV